MVASSAAHGNGHAQGPAGPNPYDLYIRTPEVAALWACDSGHPDELRYRCSLAALEMGLALLADASRDARPAGRQRARLEALADSIVDQVALARKLLGEGAPAPLPRGPPGAASPSVEALRSLAPAHRDLVARITDALLLAGFPAPLGIEAQLDAIRAGLGLPRRGVPAGPPLPYARWAQPERVAALVARDPPEGPEDSLFATVHQMTECWLRLAMDELRNAEGLARGGGPWDRAAWHAERAAAILDFVGRHIQLLHLMVVADYHPLRVTLRGASGAQSAAARAVAMAAPHLLPPLVADLSRRGLAVLDVQRRPHEHPAEHAYLEALTALEVRLMTFYYQHYQLARKVLGTRALGSLGYEVSALAERFTRPIFRALDEACYDHTMVTNLAHGGEAGRIIDAAERPLLPAQPAAGAPAAPHPATAARVLEAYFAAIRALDIEAWTALFHPHGTMEDPVGSRPHRGLAELRVFFQGVLRTFAALDVRPGPAVLRGTEVEVRWQARGTAYNGRPVAFEGTEVFELDAGGRIVAVRVWWDPAVLVPQLLAPGPPPATFGPPPEAAAATANGPSAGG